LTDAAAEQHPHVDKAHEWARQVLSGEINHCNLVKLACQRHFDDLEKSREEEYPYYYDPEAAEKVCRFIEKLPHVKGEWAKRKEQIRLQPWQCFCVAVPFGWKRKADGFRRFSESYLEIPRKNAKSTLSAGVGLYMTVADGEEGAEVFSGATSLDQALMVFDPAKKMAERARGFADHFGIEVFKRSLVVAGTNSFFRPLVRDPGDGDSPSCSIVDEYHEHPTDALYDAMKTGMGARNQPMQWIITTAGTNLAGPCREKRLEAEKILEGVLQDDTLFTIVFTIDKDDDWKDFNCWIKANPNYGISVKAHYLQGQYSAAIKRARKQNINRCKHLNEWLAVDTAWMNMAELSVCVNTLLRLDDFKGKPVYIPLDLASKIDLAAKMYLFREGDNYYVFGRYWLPEAQLEPEKNEHYRAWANAGWITVTPGNIIDFDEIEESLIEDRSDFQILEVPYDPFQATQLVTHMLAEGFPMVEVGATVKNFSEPMKELEALIKDKRFHYNGDPVLTWAFSNVVAHLDKKDNIFPNKPSKSLKIDPVVATIMGLSRAMVHAGPQESAYQHESILIL
jgi:phage terminase large subunit-like protein